MEQFGRRCARCEMSFMAPSYTDPGLGLGSEYGYRVREYQPGETSGHGRVVIYVPGNAGSFEQIRSLGSVLKGLQDVRVLALDLRGELSAFDSGKLLRQAEYLASVLRALPNREITVVGHSMGGIVARMAACRGDIAGKKINVVALATPQRPPVDTIEMAEIYRSIDSLECGRLLSIHPGLSDVQASGQRTSAGCRVDQVPRPGAIRTTRGPSGQTRLSGPLPIISWRVSIRVGWGWNTVRGDALVRPGTFPSSWETGV